MPREPGLKSRDACCSDADEERGNVAADGDRLHVILSSPHDGWIEVTVGTEKTEFAEAVSYTPNDFITGLVKAVCLLMEGQDGLAVASCEPTTYDFRFSKETDTEKCQFDIVGFPDWHRHEHSGEVVFSFRASKEEVVLPFWRALRNLEGRIAASEYRDAMRREFPSPCLQRLSRLLSK
jgi:hypothetical protein